MRSENVPIPIVHKGSLICVFPALTKSQLVGPLHAQSSIVCVEIEAEVLSRPSEADDLHVGSVKFMTGARRPAAAPRIPSFGMGVASNVANRPTQSTESSSEDDTDDELAEAVMGLSHVDLTSGWSDTSAGIYLPCT
jgi:hypothetical protein